MICKGYLTKLLDYNPETGEFTWKVSRRGVKKGTKAGCVDNNLGYVRITIDSKPYLAHRLVWLYTTGDWPKHEIDHINRNTFDNRIENLRDVTEAENKRNKGRGWSYRTTNDYLYAQVGFTNTEGKLLQKKFSCKKLGWLTAGKMAAKFVKENRPKEYQGARGLENANETTATKNNQ